MGSDSKFVTAQAKIGNVQVPVNTITLRHSINSLPNIEISTQLSNYGSKGGVAIDTGRFRELNQLMQQKFYNNFSIQPDTIVEVVDGDGNSLKFNGFLTQPTTNIASGGLRIGFSAVHIGAALQAFNDTVYDVDELYSYPEFAQFFSVANIPSYPAFGQLSQLEQLPTINASEDVWNKFMGTSANYFELGQTYKTDSVSHRIFGILQNRHNELLKALQTKDPALVDVLNIGALNANTSVLPYIKNLCMGSFKTSVINGISDPFFEDDALHATIFKILISSPNFLVALLEYLTPFLFQLNATWDGRLAMEPNQFITDPGQRLIQAPMENISFAIASEHELPIAQVFVQGDCEEFFAYGGNFGPSQQPVGDFTTDLLGNVNVDVTPQTVALLAFVDTALDDDAISAGNTLRIVAKYPETPSVAAGQYITALAPSWTMPVSYTGLQLTSKEITASRFARRPKQYEQNWNTLKSKSQARTLVLDYLAESIFKSLYLMRTNASVTIPLNLKVQVGRTYVVQSMDGGDLYTGYLNGVTHNINLDPQGGFSSTTLDFSHIKVTGAKLNGLQ